MILWQVKRIDVSIYRDIRDGEFDTLDGQGDCPDWSDEQSFFIVKKYNDFEHCYKQASFYCDEHWCGRELELSNGRSIGFSYHR